MKSELHNPTLPRLAASIFLAALLCGCASSRYPCAVSDRKFNFATDTFAYANELVWEYHYDAEGKWTTSTRVPKPSYAQHCMVVASSARQFFDHARFDPSLPVVDAATYRRLIHRVVSCNPRRPSPDSKKIVIPGYADLRSFSEANEQALKEECGGAWRGYFQRGNWRYIFPFSRGHQAKMAEQMLAHLQTDRPLIVHAGRFPQLTINHALLVFDAVQAPSEIRFDVYDPNLPAQPTTLIFDRATRTFNLPANNYFMGGRVDVYEIYYRWNY